MLFLFNIQTLEEHAGNKQYDYNEGNIYTKLLHLLNQGRDFIKDENVQCIYPKLLYTTQEIEVIYFAKDDNILILKVIDNINLKIEFHKKTDINSIIINGNISMYLSERRYDTVIKFNDNNELILNSINDAFKEDYIQYYSAAIVSIINLLTNFNKE
jgi:hypothetical protein